MISLENVKNIMENKSRILLDSTLLTLINIDEFYIANSLIDKNAKQMLKNITITSIIILVILF